MLVESEEWRPGLLANADGGSAGLLTERPDRPVRPDSFDLWEFDGVSRGREEPERGDCVGVGVGEADCEGMGDKLLVIMGGRFGERMETKDAFDGST